jgi:hypothetical protein
MEKMPIPPYTRARKSIDGTISLAAEKNSGFWIQIPFIRH